MSGLKVASAVVDARRRSSLVLIALRHGLECQLLERRATHARWQGFSWSSSRAGIRRSNGSAASASFSNAHMGGGGIGWGTDSLIRKIEEIHKDTYGSLWDGAEYCYHDVSHLHEADSVQTHSACSMTAGDSAISHGNLVSLCKRLSKLSWDAAPHPMIDRRSEAQDQLFGLLNAGEITKDFHGAIVNLSSPSFKDVRRTQNVEFKRVVVFDDSESGEAKIAFRQFDQKKGQISCYFKSVELSMQQFAWFLYALPDILSQWALLNHVLNADGRGDVATVGPDLVRPSEWEKEGMYTVFERYTAADRVSTLMKNRRHAEAAAYQTESFTEVSETLSDSQREFVRSSLLSSLPESPPWAAPSSKAWATAGGSRPIAGNYDLEVGEDTPEMRSVSEQYKEDGKSSGQVLDVDDLLSLGWQQANHRSDMRQVHALAMQQGKSIQVLYCAPRDNESEMHSGHQEWLEFNSLASFQNWCLAHLDESVLKGRQQVQDITMYKLV